MYGAVKVHEESRDLDKMSGFLEEKGKRGGVKSLKSANKGSTKES